MRVSSADLWRSFWRAPHQTTEPSGKGDELLLAVESANAALKRTFAALSRGFFRVFGQTKMTVLLGFTLAGYNLDRIRSFRAKQRAQEADKPKAPKRRRGTWTDVVEPTTTVDGTESPPD